MAEPPYNPDYVDVNDSWKLWVVLSIFTALLLITTIARVATRIYFLGSLALDDYFILLASAFNIVATGFDSNAIAHGFGRHLQFIPEDDLVIAKKYSQIAVLFAWLALWACKASVCWFLLRLIHGTHKWFRMFLWSLQALVVIVTFVTALLWGLQARPLAALWDDSIQASYREDPHDWITSADVLYAISALTSFAYAFSPIFWLWNVRIEPAKKHAIYLLMGLGSLVGVQGILIIIFNSEFLKPDTTWAVVPIYICSIIERNFGVVVTNLAPLRPLFAAMFRRTPAFSYYYPDQYQEMSKQRKVTEYNTNPNSPGLVPPVLPFPATMKDNTTHLSTVMEEFELPIQRPDSSGTGYYSDIESAEIGIAKTMSVRKPSHATTSGSE